MSEAVTKLTVLADGSIQALDRFEKGMSDAGAATDRATGAVANYEARMAKARAAMEAGLAISTQVVARRSVEQRAYDNLAASVDRNYAVRIRLEREAERAAVSAANAVNMGYISNEQALTTLMAVEQRHATQLAKAATANSGMAASLRTTASAADEAASAIMRYGSANDNAMRGGNVNAAHTTNLLFQAQDIAMMTAMGQAPAMLAMQQGMQVAGIFHQIGNGRQIVQALGGAIAGLLNPINLATIAVIGLGAAGVQWFMSSRDGAEDAATALDRYNGMLEQTLRGYGRVRSAAEEAFEAATRAPEASVTSNLYAEQAKAQERLQAAMEGALRLQRDFQGYAMSSAAFRVPDDIAASLRVMSEEITEITADAHLSRTELDRLHTSLTRLSNTTADQNIRAIAQEALAVIDPARQAAAELRGLAAAIYAADRDVQIRISMSQDFGSELENVRSHYMDPRSRFDIAREQLETDTLQASRRAQSFSQALGVASEYERVLASINQAEAEADARAANRRRPETPADRWGDDLANFEQRISSQRLETELMTATTFEAERQRAEFDLLNQAKAAGVAVTPELELRVNALATSYADAAIEAAAMRMEIENRGPFETLAADMANLEEMLQRGALSWEQYGAAAVRANSGAAAAVLGLAGQATGALSQMFKDSKEFAVANAVVSTAEAVMKAFATYGPTPWGFAAAGIAAATGAAQIATITSAQKGSSSIPSVSGGTVAQPTIEGGTSRVANITFVGDRATMSREQMEQFARELQDLLGDGNTTINFNPD